jgi:hypothetical protein
MKLISKHNEYEKKIKIEPENKKINKDFEQVKKYLNIETDFIKKLNQDLKYEIEFFKQNIESNIYKDINELYLNKYKKQSEIFDKLNEIISLESDSETSSKDENFDNIENSETNNTKKNNKKKEKSESINSEDDF